MQRLKNALLRNSGAITLGLGIANLWIWVWHLAKREQPEAKMLIILIGIACLDNSTHWETIWIIFRVHRQTSFKNRWRLIDNEFRRHFERLTLSVLGGICLYAI